jgi:hypothetical protein
MSSALKRLTVVAAWCASGHVSARVRLAAPRAYISAVAAASTAARAPAGAAASHPAFELVSSELVNEYGVVANRYVHKLTRAELLSVVAPDEDNKVFLAAFRTQPDEAVGSTGVAHILEHSVLCGSAAYPLKAPFVELLKGSVHTFLNALTYGDRTVYPVASQSLADFYNLMDVYIDATLCPIAADARAPRGRQIFEQEGWHVAAAAAVGEAAAAEPTPAASASSVSPLSLQGVVYNEMKGVYSSADSLHGRAVVRALFPETAYRWDSGGDPADIPKLSYDAFAAFHAQRYAPSAALLFASGDDPELERLARIDAALARAHAHRGAPAPVAPVAPVGRQPLRTEPWTVASTYPAAASDGASEGAGAYVSLNWLLSEDELPASERLALSMLSSLLLGSAAAPLRAALLRSRLGSALIGGGLGDSLVQPTFSVGLKGVASGKDAAAAVQALVLRTLERIADGEDVGAADGAPPTGRSAFDAEAVGGALNALDFRLREFAASERRGLSLGLAAAGEWAHGRDPVEGWRYEADVAELKARLAAEGAPALFGALLRSRLLSNGHRVTVTLEPSADHAPARDAAEAAARDAAAGGAELDALRARTATLRAAQAAADPPELVARLPRLRLDQLEMACAPPIACASSRRAKATLPATPAVDAAGGPSVLLLQRALPSAGIVHLDLGLSLAPVLAELADAARAAGGWAAAAQAADARTAAAAASAASDLHLLPLLWRVLREGGTAARDDVAFSRALRLHTGGLAGSVLSTPAVSGPLANTPAAGFGNGALVGFAMLRGKALAGKEGELASLVEEALLQPDLASERARGKLREMAAEARAATESAARSSGNALATSRLAAATSLDGWVGEQLGGLARARALPALCAQLDDDAAWPALARRLQGLHARLLGGAEAFISLTADEAQLDGALAATAHLRDAIATAGGAPAVAAAAAAAAADDAAAAAALGGGALLRGPIAEGLRVPTAVSHAAASAVLPGGAAAVRGSAAVATRLLRTGHLWSRVRVQGGAYGAAASLDRWSGALTLSSYRDPTPAGSLGAFREAGAALREAARELPDAELERLVIGTLGALEPPSSPAGRAYASLVRELTGLSDAMRQEWRDEVRGTGRAELLALADAIDVALTTPGAPPSVAVVGEQKALDAVDAALVAMGGRKLDVRNAL